MNVNSADLASQKPLESPAKVPAHQHVYERVRKLILFGERHLRRALNEFVAHYHKQRPHQGIRNDLIEPSSNAPPNGDRVVVDERLGGLLRSYRRTA